MISTLQAMQLHFQPIGGWLTAVVAALAFIILLTLAYRHVQRPVGRGRLRLLTALRLAAAALVIVVMLRPALLISETRPEQSVVALLQDVSASMSIADAGRGRSRGEAVRQMLDEQQPSLLSLADKCRIAAYSFGEKLSVLVDATADGSAVSAPAAATGNNRRPPDFAERPPGPADVVWQLSQALQQPGQPSTRLGEALKQLGERHLARPPAAVVLISDGRETLSAVSAREAAANLASRNVRLYVLQAGADDAAPETPAAPAIRDVVLRNFHLPEQAFVGNQVQVRAELLIRGYQGQSVQVDLLVDGRVRGGEKIEVDSAEQIQRIELPLAVEAPGEHRVALRAAAMPDELTLRNNELHGWLTASEGGIKVLLISGSLRTEGLYLSRALRQAGEFELRRVVVPDAAAAAELLPVDSAGWAEYNVIILDDISASTIGTDRLEALSQAVGNGSGLAMLGSRQCAFAAGGYNRSPLATALPIVMGNREPASLERIRFLPKAAGFRTRVMQVEASPAESEKAWQSLPVLLGGHNFEVPRQTADVLAATESGEPLLVVGQHQRGRVAALAVDTTWQWVLEGDDEPPGALHQRFWRQLVLLLAGQDAAGAAGGVFVTTDRSRYSLPAINAGRQAVAVSAAVTDARGRSVTDASLELKLTGPDGRTVPLRKWDRGQQSECTLEPHEAGDYLLTLSARRGAEELGTARRRFIVDDPDLELEQPTADAALLAELATATGGRVYQLNEADSLFADLSQRLTDRATVVSVSHDLWDNYLVLAAFVALLGGEWTLRKRLQLV